MYEVPKQFCNSLILGDLQPFTYFPVQSLYDIMLAADEPPPFLPSLATTPAFSCSSGVNIISVSSIIPARGLVNIFHSSGLSVKLSKNWTNPPVIFMFTAHKSAIVGIFCNSSAIVFSSSSQVPLESSIAYAILLISDFDNCGTSFLAAGDLQALITCSKPDFP